MAGVNEQCCVRAIVKADWSRPRNQNTEVYMIILQCDKLPEYTRIPAEPERTKIYEYNDKPLLFKKCFKYGHTEKRLFRSLKDVCNFCVAGVLKLDTSLKAVPVRW